MAGVGREGASYSTARLGRAACSCNGTNSGCPVASAACCTQIRCNRRATCTLQNRAASCGVLAHLQPAFPSTCTLLSHAPAPCCPQSSRPQPLRATGRDIPCHSLETAKEGRDVERPSRNCHTLPTNAATPCRGATACTQAGRPAASQGSKYVCVLQHRVAQFAPPFPHLPDPAGLPAAGRQSGQTCGGQRGWQEASHEGMLVHAWQTATPTPTPCSIPFRAALHSKQRVTWLPEPKCTASTAAKLCCWFQRRPQCASLLLPPTWCA